MGRAKKGMTTGKASHKPSLAGCTARNEPLLNNKKTRPVMHVIYFKSSAHYLDVIRVLHTSMDVDMHLKDNA